MAERPRTELSINAIVAKNHKTVQNAQGKLYSYGYTKDPLNGYGPQVAAVPRLECDDEPVNIHSSQKRNARKDAY